LLKLFGSWDHPSFPKMRFIPFVVLWGIWKYKNTIIFEDLHQNDAQIITNIIMDIKEHAGNNARDRMNYILIPV